MSLNTGKKKLLLVLGVVVVLAVLAGTGCGVLTLLGGGKAEVDPNQNAAQQEPKDTSIEVAGRLVFPVRAELTFDTSGEVGQILVEEGEWVSEGQLLARLDDVTFRRLEQAVAQAELDLDEARDALEEASERFEGIPLEEAEFQQEIAAARKAKDDAEEKLSDFQRDQQQNLSDAMQSVADAQVSLDDAEEKLRDFQRDSSQDLAAALKAKIDAELALDSALEQVQYFGRDRDKDVADALKARALAETKLDDAQEALAEFDQDYEEDLADARLVLGNAKKAVETAEDALTVYVRALGRTISFNPDEDQEENESVRELRRLQTAVEEARATRNQSEITLRELEGDRELLLQDRRAAVDAAVFDLQKANDKVLEVRDQSDQDLEQAKRQAAVESAEAKLEQAIADLDEELAGPDPARLSQLEAAVEVARADLEQAKIDLEEEMEGPDQAELELRQADVKQKNEALDELVDGPEFLEVSLKTAQVKAAEAKLEEALEDFDGAILRAPFAGRIFLVNLEIDDPVSDESRVIQLVDPRIVHVVGLLDAIDRPALKGKEAAQIRIDSLGDQLFAGVITEVGDLARTERGVVSYALTVEVEVPPEVEVPLTPTSVSVVVKRTPAVG